MWSLPGFWLLFIANALISFDNCIRFSAIPFVLSFIFLHFVDLFCPPHNSNNIWPVLIIFGRYLSQTKKACGANECEFSLPWFLGYLSYKESCSLCNSKTFRKSTMILVEYLTSAVGVSSTNLLALTVLFSLLSVLVTLDNQIMWAS